MITHYDSHRAIKSLKDDSDSVRQSAIDALKTFKIEGITPMLIKSLESDSPSLRQSSINALQSLKIENITPTLIKSIEENSTIKPSAINYLSSLNIEKSIPLIINSIKNDDSYDYTINSRTFINFSSIKPIEFLTGAIFSKEGKKPSSLKSNFSLSYLENIIKKHKFSFLENWFNKIKIINKEEDYSFTSNPNLQKLTPQQLIENIKKLDTPLNERIESLGLLVKSKEVKIAREILLVWINNKEITKNYGHVIYTYLMDLHDGKTLARQINRSDISLASRVSALNILMASSQAILARPTLLNWVNDKKIVKKYGYTIYTHLMTLHESRTIYKQINNPNITHENRVNALDILMKSKHSMLAKPVLIEWLNNNEKNTQYGHRIYNYLIDLKATETVNTVQQQLGTLDQKWKNWREQRDHLSENADDEEKQAITEQKPNPNITAYTYANTITRLGSNTKGIELLKHNLYEARRGAWEGLARTATVNLVKKLDKLRSQANDDPLYKHALYRAIDESLIHIDVASSNAESSNIVETYKQDCKALDVWLKSGNLDKKSVAPRVEWTRDRIDETLESLVRLEWRIKHWFDEEWPEKSYQYESCYDKQEPSA